MSGYENRLNRMFSGWTDAEVKTAFEAIRESGARRHSAVVFEDFWREYARRTWPDGVFLCSRCGSDNHGTANHDEWAS